MPDHPIVFSSSGERDAWIIQNANYFTVIRRKNREYRREEVPTLAEAEALARRMISEAPDIRCLIYAVAGLYDCFVKSIGSDQ